MPVLLQDPPDLQDYAARGDPPMARWPGNWVTKYALMAACGDERDWFRYGHRYEAYCRAWHLFCDARRRRRRFSSGFTWNQVLIIGPYGSKKTSLGIKIALEFFKRGHPVFSNASVLFGWHLDSEEMYTAMGRMPKHAVLLIDESSAALASRVGHGVAISTFSEMNLNTRKKNCLVIYMTAHDWELAASIRQHCKELWKPLADDLVTVEDSAKPANLMPGMDPDNFTIAWDAWTDFPFEKQDLIEGKAEEKGFPDPDATLYDEGENVRDAYLLNDTFELAKAGAATTADREVVRTDLRRFQDEISTAGMMGGGPDVELTDSGMSTRDAKLSRTIDFFRDEMHAGGKSVYRAADLAEHLDLSLGEAGQLIQRAFPVQPRKRGGYSGEDIFGYLAKMEAATEG